MQEADFEEVERAQDVAARVLTTDGLEPWRRALL
jgi:hypothetical protein